MNKKYLFMLASLLTVSTGVWAESYNISSDIFGSGTVTVKNGNNVVTSADAGTTLTVILQAAEGYIVNGANIDNVSVDYNTFDRQSDSYWVGTITMPESNITIKPDFVKPYASLSALPQTGKYTIGTTSTEVKDRDNNSLGIETGTLVTLTVTAETGYAIESVTARTYSNATYTDFNLTDNGNGTWSFTMPAEEVYVNVAYYKTSGTYNIYVGTVDGTITFKNADGDPIKKADEGETVTVVAMSANAGSSYMLSSDVYTIVTVTDADNKPVEVTRSSGGYYGETISFTMPAKAVTVSAEFKNTINLGSGYGDSHGTCTITVGGETRSYADENEVVTCTFTPDEGYVLADLLVGYRDYDAGSNVYLTCTKTAENTYTFTMPGRSVSGSAVFAIPLADGESNADALTALAGGSSSTVVLSGRTLYKDGYWNTLCLPFDVEIGGFSMGTSVLADATIMELNVLTSGFNSSTGVLTLNFTEVEATGDYMPSKTLTAGKPYIVKWTSGGDVENPYFQYVNVTATTPTTVTTADGKVSFVGTFAPAALTANTSANLYLGDDNKLYYPNVNGFNVNAFRAYFTVDLDQAAVRAFVLNFGDGETSGIVEAEANASHSTLPSSLSGWYTLDGRRLSGRPATSGLYISNGCKVYVK